MVINVRDNADPMVKRIVEIANKNNLRPEQLCIIIGIPYSTWNKWIAGKTFTRSYDRLTRLDKFINNPKEFIKGA